MQTTMSSAADQGEDLRYAMPTFRYRKDNATWICATLGVVLNGLSYQSFEPHIVAAAFFMLGMVLFRYTSIGGNAEWRMFRRVFSVGFFAAGIAAFYVEVWRDAVQLYSDPAGFYRLARLNAIRGLNVAQTVLLTDGSLMLFVWTPVYDFFQQWGVARGRFVGVTVNTVLVAFNGVIGIKMLRKIYGDDPYRFNRLIQLMSACGIFWMFAALHVRDSGVLTVMTLLTYACLTFVQQPDFGRRLLLMLLCFYAADWALEYLRNEFRFLPAIMLVGMVYALRSATQSRRLRRLASFFSVVGLALILVVLVEYGQQAGKTLEDAHDGYEDVAERTVGAAQSLGFELIVNQPLPVRVVLGTAYTYLAPIPVWLGFLFPSALHLFKSINTLFNYFLLPLMMTACLLIFRYKSLRTPPIVYVATTTVVFSVAVGLSSMELRHLGAFYMMPLMLATVPDLRQREDWSLFRSLVRLMLYAMGMVHFLWFIIKFV